MNAVRSFAAAALTSAVVLAPALPAEAATYTPRGVCGPSFTKVVHTKDITHRGTTARLTVLWSARMKQNCAVLIKRNNTRQRTWMKVSIGEWRRGEAVGQSGYYRYYAGPVKIKAPGACITVWASMGRTSRDPRNTKYMKDRFACR